MSGESVEHLGAVGGHRLPLSLDEAPGGGKMLP